MLPATAGWLPLKPSKTAPKRLCSQLLQREAHGGIRVDARSDGLQRGTQGNPGRGFVLRRLRAAKAWKISWLN